MSCRGHHSNAEITLKNTYCAFCCAGKVLNFFFLLLYWGETIETKLKFCCSFSMSLTFVFEIFCDFCANCAVKHKVWRHAVIRTSARFIASQVFRNQHSDQLPFSLLAKLVEHCTGIAEVMDSNPVQAWIFFRPYFHYCSSSVHYCEDRFIFTSSSAVHVYDFHVFTDI